MKTGGLQRNFIDFVEDNRFLDGVQTVILAVSGGVDSMTLLSLFKACAARWNIDIIAAHFNHQLRGVEAERDEKLVKDYCAEHQIPFVAESAKVRAFAREKRISLEMAGRELRYAFFRKVAANYPDSVIATAHTIDDQAETIMLRMLKGSGLQGLSGIPLKREIIIRPLLFVTKSELYDYARTMKLPYGEDRTNFLIDCDRNVIRNRILPEVKQRLNPQIVTTLAALAQNLAEAHQFIADTASQALMTLIVNTDTNQIVLEISGLKTYFIGIEKEIIWQCLQQLASDIQTLSHKRMNSLLKLVNNGQSGRQVLLSHGITVMIDRERLILRREQKDDWPETAIRPGQPVENEYFYFNSEPVDVARYQRQAHRSATEFVDIDRVGENLYLRHWQHGDKMTPLGMQQSRKISDLFVDLKIPRHRKNNIPILTSDDKIVWLCGLIISEEFKITSTTKTALKLNYKEKQS